MKSCIRVVPVVLLVLLSAVVVAQPQPVGEFQQLLTELAASKKISDKRRCVTALANTDHEARKPVLQALQDGALYYRKSDRAVVIARREQQNYNLTDAVSGDELGAVTRRSLKKISINNTLRRQLRSIVAELDPVAAL